MNLTNLVDGEKYAATTGNPNSENIGLNTAIFSNTNLSNANLTGANLSNANLNKSNLTGANLTSSTMNANTNLTGTIISNTNFSSATLNGVKFNTVIGDNTSFNSANLTNTTFTQPYYPTWTNVDFSKAITTGLTGPLLSPGTYNNQTINAPVSFSSIGTYVFNNVIFAGSNTLHIVFTPNSGTLTFNKCTLNYVDILPGKDLPNLSILIDSSTLNNGSIIGDTTNAVLYANSQFSSSDFPAYLNPLQIKLTNSTCTNTQVQNLSFTNAFSTNANFAENNCLSEPVQDYAANTVFTCNTTESSEITSDSSADIAFMRTGVSSVSFSANYSPLSNPNFAINYKNNAICQSLLSGGLGTMYWNDDNNASQPSCYMANTTTNSNINWPELQ